MSMYGLFFETEKDIEEYMAHPDYGIADDRPKLCAAISYKRGAGGESDHNFKLHYVDWDNYKY